MKYARPLLPLFFLTLPLIVFHSCGGAHMPLDDFSALNPTGGSSAKSAGTSSAAAVEVTFQDVKPIFKKACATCHAPGAAIPNWMDYSVASKLKDRIFNRVVVQKTMPLGAALPADEIALIAKWIKLGAVEKNPETVEEAQQPQAEEPQIQETQTQEAQAQEPEAPAAPVRCEDAAPKYEGTIPTLAGDYKDQISHGHAAFIKNGCNTCHGNTGHGDGPVAVAFNPKPRNFFTEDFKKGSSAAEVFGTITMGFCAMPAYGASISDTERMEIATFLAGVRQNDAEAQALFTEPAAPAPTPKALSPGKKPSIKSSKKRTPKN